MTFEALTEIARKTLNPRALSSHSEAGGVAAALLTEAGNVYTGVCIDTPCGMGFCAEHAAAAAMVTAGENRVVKIVAVRRNGEIIPPCGKCREFLCQLHDDNHLCRVRLADKVLTLDDLLPERWV